jgi:hypothetical protein
VLKDGSTVLAHGPASGTSAAAQILQAIKRAAGDQAVPAVLTGRPVERFQPAPSMPGAGLYPDPGGEAAGVGRHRVVARPADRPGRRCPRRDI